MPKNPTLRKITKVLCWFYLLSLLFFLSYSIIVLGDGSLDVFGARGVAFLGPVGGYTILLNAFLLLIVGTIDLRNKPRSKFALSIILADYVMVIASAYILYRGW